jgi:pimeloyl-ACP methyl ester carboxylesterase
LPVQKVLASQRCSNASLITSGGLTRMVPATRTRLGLAIERRTFFRLIAWIACLSVLATAGAAPAQTQPVSSQSSVQPTVIVVGFVGGFVRHNDDRHSEVQVIERLSEEDLPGLHATVYENRHTGEAIRQVLRWLDTDGDGRLSAEEKQNARIVLFGHSWGGSAAIKLARGLNRLGVPVAMTIQVDSVNKLFGDDCLIPPNVDEAINFYQTRGFVHGCRSLRAADPSRTRIAGNYRFAYTAQPPECHSVSWANRHFLRTHEAMDCDPHVWSQVDEKIHALMQSNISVPAPMNGAEPVAEMTHP